MMEGKKMTSVEIAVMKEKIEQIAVDVKEIKEKLEKNYVTVERYQIVEKLVYGMVALILIAVIGAIIKLVVLK